MLLYIEQPLRGEIFKIFGKGAEVQQPFRKSNTCQSTLSFIGLALSNKVPEELKRTTNLNAFKHNLRPFLVIMLFIIIF